MMRCLLLLCLIHFFLSGNAQNAHLIGDVKVVLSDGSFSANFKITQFTNQNKEFSFLLNDQLVLTRFNLPRVAFKIKSSKKNCLDCVEYTIQSERYVRFTDTLEFSVKGTIMNHPPGTNLSDYKGKIAINYGILRASEQSKWYPVLQGKKSNRPSFLNGYGYTYQIDASCQDCSSIYIGEGLPKQKNGFFESEVSQESIMLIAGDFNWEVGDYATYLNITKDQVETVDSLFEKIQEFYGEMTNHELPSKFVLAHLPSDNPTWGGFMTYPTIVRVRQEFQLSTGLEAYLSHELAHYFFGEKFKPKSNLYWFFLESFAEYYSLKYLLANNLDLFLQNYEQFKKSKGFIRLDKVKKVGQVSTEFRYTIGPFLLLALENKIGPEQMLNWTRWVFSKLSDSKDGYEVMMEGLEEVGVDDAVIRSIEENIFKKFKLSEYQFLEPKSLK